MSNSSDPKYIAHREYAVTVFAGAQHVADKEHIDAGISTMGLAELCDMFAYAIGGGGQDYASVATGSVSLEDAIIRWMRSHPEGVAAIMRGKP